MEFVRAREVQFAVIQLGRKVNWKKVSGILGRTGGNVVLQKDFILPQDCPITPIDTEPYSHKLLQTTLTYVLRQLRRPISQIKIALYDPRGVQIDYALALVRYCGSLKIVTAKAEMYADFAEHMMEEYGAVVRVVSQFDNPNDNTLIVSPGQLDAPLDQPITVPVLSAVEQTRSLGPYFYHAFRASTPWRYRELMPPEVDEHAYQAALYQFCGISKLGKTCAAVCTWGDRQITINQMVKSLTTLDMPVEV